MAVEPSRAAVFGTGGPKFESQTQNSFTAWKRI